MVALRVSATPRIVNSATSPCWLRFRRSAAVVCAIEVEILATPRTRWSRPWHFWHRGAFGRGRSNVNTGTPLTVSKNSCVSPRSTACWKSGWFIVRRGAGLQAPDLVDDLRLQRGIPLHLFQGGKVCKSLHPVRPEDGDLLHLLDGMQVSTQHPDNIRASFQHAALDAFHHGVGEDPGCLLALL